MLAFKLIQFVIYCSVKCTVPNSEHYYLLILIFSGTLLKLEEIYLFGIGVKGQIMIIVLLLSSRLNVQWSRASLCIFVSRAPLAAISQKPLMMYLYNLA